MRPPNPPIADDQSMKWFRQLQQSVIARTILPGKGYRLKKSSAGTILQITASATVGISLYRFKSMEDDWLVCRSWDGTNEGDTDEQIAKPYKLRFSIGSEVIDGDTVTYSLYDTSTQTRHASDGTTDEDQVIVPRYLVDDPIYVMSANTLVLDVDSNDLGLIDMNFDGRAWAAVPI